MPGRTMRSRSAAMPARPPACRGGSAGSSACDLARLHAAHHREARRCARGSRRPSRPARGRAAELAGCMPFSLRGVCREILCRRATSDVGAEEPVRDGEVGGDGPVGGVDEGAEVERPAAAEQRRIQVPERAPETGDEARRRRAARGRLARASAPPGRSTRRASARTRGVRRAQQVDHVGAQTRSTDAVRQRGGGRSPSVSSTRARPAHGASAALASSTMRGLTSTPR